MHSSEPVFTTTGTKVAPAGCVFVILAGVLFLTLLLISIFIPHRVGEWWMWTLLLVMLAVYGIYQNRKDKIKIDVLRNADRTLQLLVTGPTVNINVPLDTDRFDYWYTFERTSVRTGGGTFVIYFCAIPDGQGGTIIFKQMIGEKGSEPYNWKHGDTKPEEGPGMYHVAKLRDLVKAVLKN